ncbi:MAG: DMT family transporter [Verrucomicrobiota bacterium]
MLPALFTTFLFSVSVLLASRSAQKLGGMPANVARLSIATLLLGLWAHLFGGGFGGPGLLWFFLSGIIGFGVGDMGLFGALPRIGPRLSILLTQCLGAPIAGVAEYLLLGVHPSVTEILCAGVILVGVALALAPDQHWEGEPRVFRIGVCFGIVSALGQGLGAVLSRKGYAVAAAAGFAMDGGTAAYQRIVPGVLVTILFWAILKWSGQPTDPIKPLPVWKDAMPLVFGNALSGPTLGVACFQLALLTTPSAKVLPIVATSPLVTMGLAWAFQGIKPQRKAVIGGCLAVLGAVGLAWLKATRIA